MALVGSVVTTAPRRFARYSRTNRAPAVLLLFGLAVGLWALRRGRLPTARQTAGFLIAAIALVLWAAVLPEIAVAFMAAALIAIAIDDSDTIARVASRLNALIGDPLGARSPATPPASTVTPRPL